MKGMLFSLMPETNSIVVLRVIPCVAFLKQKLDQDPLPLGNAPAWWFYLKKETNDQQISCVLPLYLTDGLNGPKNWEVIKMSMSFNDEKENVRLSGPKNKGLTNIGAQSIVTQPEVDAPIIQPDDPDEGGT